MTLGLRSRYNFDTTGIGTGLNLSGYTYLIYKEGSNYVAYNTLTGGLVATSDDAAVTIETVLNDGNRYNKSVKCVGFVSGENWELKTTLDFPSLQNYLFDAKDVTFTGQGVVLDSIMDTKLIFGVLDCHTNGVVLDIKPTNDSEIIGTGTVYEVIDSAIEVSSVVGPGKTEAGSVGCRLNVGASKGISFTRIHILNIHGVERAFYAPNPDSGGHINNNDIYIGRVYDCVTGLQDGDTGASGFYDNYLRVGYVSADTTGLAIYGQRGRWEIGGFDTGSIDPGKAIVWGDSAAENLVDANRRIWDIGVTDNSTASTNRIRSSWRTETGYLMIGSSIPGGIEKASTTYFDVEGPTGISRIFCYGKDTSTRGQFSIFLRSSNGSTEVANALFLNSDAKLGLGTIDPKAKLHATESTIVGCASAAVADADLGNNQVNIWVDEAGSKLTFKVKFSNGTVKSGTVALT